MPSLERQNESVIFEPQHYIVYFMQRIQSSKLFSKVFQQFTSIVDRNVFNLVMSEDKTFSALHIDQCTRQTMPIHKWTTHFETLSCVSLIKSGSSAWFFFRNLAMSVAVEWVWLGNG